MTAELTPAELSRTLAHYELGGLIAARRIERGFVNESWVVVTDRDRYFLKRRHPVLCCEPVIQAQHELMERLYQAGFPAPQVLPTVAGETWLVLEGECYEVHQYIPGGCYDLGRSAHLAEAARILGRYHGLVRGWAPPALCARGGLYGPTLVDAVLDDLIQAWELEWASHFTPSLAALRAQAADLSERFARHGSLPGLIIHGDYYANNLLFDDDGVVGVVDYDRVRWQPRVVEVAEALIYFASPRPGHLRQLVYPGFLDWDLCERFLGGYSRVAPLNGAELGALPDYVRCIWLQMSLCRLVEGGRRPPQAAEALAEVLALADWAQANGAKMIEIGLL